MPQLRSHRHPFLLFGALGLLTTALVPAGCGSDDGGGNAACQKEQLLGCGDECTSTSDCESGLYCNRMSNLCEAACIAGDDESSYCDGKACKDDGQCSGQPDLSTEAIGNAACEEEDLEGCGEECGSSSDCKEGLYCSAGSRRCAAACVAGKKDSKYCDGAVCESDGQCEGAEDLSIEGRNTIGGGIGAGGANGGGGESCIDVQVDFEPQIPSVVLLIDQSGSMDARNNYDDAVDVAIDAGVYEPWNCDSDDYDWRWNVVRNVVLNPDTGIVKPLEDRVRFGLSLYTNEDSCPELTTVDTSLNNHGEMLDAFVCSDTKGDTPTRESLTATAVALAAYDEPGPKVIVLATDGAPDTCECPNWNNSAGPGCGQSGKAKEEQDKVVAEAKRIYEELGIVVQVIDVSGQSANLTEHLTEVAQAGGGARYDGEQPGDLIDAFDTIIDGARSCAIDLDGEIEAGKKSSGSVSLDGTKLQLDDPDGYRVNDSSQIELLGDACQTIKSGDHDIDITFPCGTFVQVTK